MRGPQLGKGFPGSARPLRRKQAQDRLARSGGEVGESKELRESLIYTDSIISFEVIILPMYFDFITW